MVSALLIFSFLGFANQPAPHDLPDGCVKVATQVLVQADQTQIRYDIGFNPTTLDQLLKVYSPDFKSDASLAEKVEAFRVGFKEKIGTSLQVKLGDKVVKPEEIIYEPEEVAKHVQVRFTLNYEILVKEESKIEISDTCLQESSRIWNAGFKAAKPIAVKDCSTRAIPLRSKTVEKAAGESEPFMISGTVVPLIIDVPSEPTASMAPLFVLFFALGGAGMVGILLVPNQGGDDHHDDHH